MVEGEDFYDDYFDGGAGYDRIVGGAGDDTNRVYELDSWKSIEEIDGGVGTNMIKGTIWDDETGARVASGTGRYFFSGEITGSQPPVDDKFNLAYGEFYLTDATPPDLQIDGGAGNYQLIGLAGSDSIVGGSDWLIGDNVSSRKAFPRRAIDSPFSECFTTSAFDGGYRRLGDDAKKNQAALGG